MTPLGLPLSTFIELLASGVVALGTIFSGLVARQSVVEARKLRQMQDEPHIVVTLWLTSVGSHYLNMWVENTGTGTAYDLKLTTDANIQILGGKYLSEVGVFAYGIPCFPPGHQLVFCVGDMSEMRQNGNTKLTVSAIYRNSRGTHHDEAFPLNTESQSGVLELMETGTRPLNEMARSLNDIKDALRTGLKINK